MNTHFVVSERQINLLKKLGIFVYSNGSVFRGKREYSFLIPFEVKKDKEYDTFQIQSSFPAQYCLIFTTGIENTQKEIKNMIRKILSIYKKLVKEIEYGFTQ